jgi:hypothetical protein
MEREFQKLNLHTTDLSTVHEQDERQTLTKDNIKLLNKQQLLQKYIEDSKKNRNADDFSDDDYEDDSNFDERVKHKLTIQQQESQGRNENNKENNKLKLKSVLKTPISNHMLTMTGYKANHESASSFSSRTPSSVNSYSETETEHSDYAADFDDYEFQHNNINLIQIFKQKQLEAKKIAEQTRHDNFQKYQKQNAKLTNRNQRIKSKYYGDDNNYNEFAEIDDFSDDLDFKSFGKLDPSKLNRFKDNSIRSKFLGRKKSMPAMKTVTGFNGSPKKIKRYSSTLDIKNNLDTLNNKNYSKAFTFKESQYPVFVEDELENVADYDLTITLSDYKKLKRKSQKFDLSKYAETPSQHHFKHKESKIGDQNLIHLISQDSQTSRLTKEGKIKLIRSLNKPKVKKVLPGHLYGEITYDPSLKKWCGNDEDLVRFESLNHSKPQLINRPNDIPQVVGNMIYDEKKLRWVSVTGSYEDDPFDDDFDTTIKYKEPEIQKPISRGVSSRLVPSESNMSLGDHLRKQSQYHKVTPEMYKNWKVEEERWVRKVGNWFPNHENTHDFKYELKVFLDHQ